jgi:hypothetical protein
MQRKTGQHPAGSVAREPAFRESSTAREKDACETSEIEGFDTGGRTHGRERPKQEIYEVGLEGAIPVGDLMPAYGVGLVAERGVALLGISGYAGVTSIRRWVAALDCGALPPEPMLTQIETLESGTESGPGEEPGTDIVNEPGSRGLLRADGAAGPIAIGFEHQRAHARARQDARGHQSVGPRADHDGIDISATSRHTRLQTLR